MLLFAFIIIKQDGIENYPNAEIFFMLWILDSRELKNKTGKRST